MDVRAFVDDDWDRLWPFMAEIIRAGDTFPYDPAMTSSQTRAAWVTGPPGHALVADDGGALLGTATMGPNKAGPGGHVATASFMVAPAARGRGVGAALVRAALGWAEAHGFAGMQFNAVAATNRGAVALYEREGFAVVGTVPGAFAHPVHGRVGLHVMYRELTPSPQPASAAEADVHPRRVGHVARDDLFQ